MSDDRKHKVVSAIKEFAAEHERSPTRREMRERLPIGVLESFPLFNDALAAAGRSPNKKRQRGAYKHLFDADVLEIVSKAENVSEAFRFDSKLPLLVIPDTHFPFSSNAVLSAIYAYCEKKKPKQAIQVGDLYDMFSHASSKMPRSRNVYNPWDEMELGFKRAREMWTEIQKLCPGIQCFQIVGNHDIRPLKRILEAYPEGEIFFSTEKYFRFPGVTTVTDPRQELYIGDACCMHGHYSRPGQHRDYNLENTIHGHTHRGGVYYRMIKGKVLWELDAGLAGDIQSKAMAWTAQRTTLWTPGFGVRDEYGPRFIPV